MTDLFRKIEKRFNEKRWKELASEIYRIEANFCYKDFEKSANLCAKELEKSEAKNVEIIKLKADGETVYGDFIMPQAWDWKQAYLEIFQPVKYRGKILADTKIHPFHIANRSCNIKEKFFDVLDIKNISGKKNLKNCFVFCGNIHPRECYNDIEKTGAVGIISSFSKAPEKKDGIFWVNGWVKNSGWYQTKQDRKMACLSITPASGEFLKKLLSKSPVKVKAYVKSRIYDGSIYSITGLIPGKKEKEICFLAHLYEPMITDNATGVAGLIELCRILNEMIKNGEFEPEISIRFLFSMERYGMAQFFERKHNVIYAFNVDSITDDIVKTKRLHYTFYQSPFSLPFFGDWVFESILGNCFLYPWKKELPAYEDDSFVSDLSIGIPSGYLVSHPGRLHHNSYISKTVNWQQGKNALAVVGTYFSVLSSPEKENPILEKFAKKELFSYFARICNLVEKAPEDYDFNSIQERVRFFSDYLKKKYFSANSCGIKCKNSFSKEIDEDCKVFLKNFSKEFNLKNNFIFLSREDKKAQNLIITERKKVFIFSLAEIPHKKRIHTTEGFHNLINKVDGKKDLYEIFKHMDFEREIFGLQRLDEQQKKSLRKYVEYLAKYGYLNFRYKVVITKGEIKETLKNLGIKRNDRIIVHSSLSGIGYVEGGAKTVCEALMELIGPDGVIMMPSFNHGIIFKNNPQSYFSPLETETINGTIPQYFWKIKEVYRSLDPTHSFAVWGKNAKDFVRNHHKVLTMGKGSPLELIEEAGGKIVLIDATDSNTFHHVVEMTNNVPCLGKRTQKYRVKLPSGETVYIRSWTWRNGSCEITDKLAYMKYMLKNKLLKKGKLGNANVFVIDMKICRRVIEMFLKGRIKGFSGCKKCNIRPLKDQFTVESDWDEKEQKVKQDSDSFILDYEPVSL